MPGDRRGLAQQLLAVVGCDDQVGVSSFLLARGVQFALLCSHQVLVAVVLIRIGGSVVLIMMIVQAMWVGRIYYRDDFFASFAPTCLCRF